MVMPQMGSNHFPSSASSYASIWLCLGILMNINRGLWRVWLVGSAIWIAFYGYEAYLHNENWKGWSSLAISESEANDQKKLAAIEKSLDRARLTHNRAVIAGITSDDFDEEVARKDAASSAISRFDEMNVRDWNQNARDQKILRDSSLQFLFIAPFLAGLVFIGAGWIIVGFKRSL